MIKNIKSIVSSELISDFVIHKLYDIDSLTPVVSGTETWKNQCVVIRRNLVGYKFHSVFFSKVYQQNYHQIVVEIDQINFYDCWGVKYKDVSITLVFELLDLMSFMYKTK